MGKPRKFRDQEHRIKDSLRGLLSGHDAGSGPEGRRWGGCRKEEPQLRNRVRHHDSDTILLEFPLEIYFENHLVVSFFNFMFIVSHT